MRTRTGLPIGLRLRALTTALCVAISVTAVNVTIPIAAPSSVVGHNVGDNFLGISIELAALGDIWGNTTAEIPNAMLNYLSNIRARMDAPLRIRIGGNSMDASTFDASYTQNLLSVTDASTKDVILITYGPVLFDILNAVADTVGSMSFVLGLSMQHPPNDSSEAYALAGVAKRALGDRLDALLLGNEPDIYAAHGTRENYTTENYIMDIGDFIDGIHEHSDNDPLDQTILGGPSTCCYWDLKGVIDAGMNQYPYKYYTYQHYPQNNCNGLNAKNTNLTYYATHANLDSYFSWQTGVAAAQAAGVASMVSEFNTVSCGGSPVSDSLAAAMWLLNAALTFAATNVTAAFVHTREGGVLYNLFDAPTDPRSGAWTTRASYYAVLAASEVFRGGGAVWDLDLQGGKTAQRATSAGYALYTEGAPARLVLFNFADVAGVPRNFTIPKGHGRLGVRMLRAADELGLAADGTQMSWAGQSVGLGGALQGAAQTSIVECADGCTLEIPGPAVALVVLDVDGRQSGTLWDGDSTLVQPPTGLLESDALISQAHVWMWAWMIVFSVVAVV